MNDITRKNTLRIHRVSSKVPHREEVADSCHSGDAISLVLSKEAEEQPVLLGVRFCEFDPDEYYKEDDRTGNGITGSETESSNIDGTKGSRETDSTVDSSISKELQGQFIYTVDIDLSGMNPGGQNLDRLAICFDKGSIELLGKTNILPQHKNYARIIPGEEEQSIPSTSYAEKIDQSQGADVSTLTSGSELDPPSSKTLSSDETDFDDWLSEFLEDDPVLEEGHPFLRHKTEIIAHALRSFRLVLQASRCPAGHSDGDSRTSTVEGTTSLTTTSSGKNSRKRSTNDTEKGDDKENGDDRGSNNGRKPPKKARVNDGVQSRNFACVFYKSNPLQHVRCLHFQLKRIRDVKQHLSRCHRQPRFYCPICFETFDDSDLRNAHIRQRMCLTRDPPNWEGVSEAQGQLLRERVSRSNTPDEQWFTIWEIVFPGAPRPSSPYLGNAFEETIDRLREYWNAEGRQVVSSSLRRHGMLNWGRPGEERDLGIFHSQTLDSIITVLLAAFVSAMAPATESSASNNSAVASDSTSVDPMLIMTPSASASSGSVARSGLDVPINPMPLPATDFESDNRVMSSVPMPADAEETTDATLLVDFQSPEFGTLYVSIEAQQLLEEGDVYADWTQDF